jgi:hypothetical protein
MAFTPIPKPSQLSQRTTADNFLALQSGFIVATPSASSIGFTNLSGNQAVTIKFFNDGSSGNTVYGCCSNSAASGGAVAAIASTTNPSFATQLFNAGQGNAFSYSISNCDAIPAGAVLTQDYAPGTNVISVITPSGYSCKTEFSIGYGQ